jgi:hypothetical protein
MAQEQATKAMKITCAALFGAVFLLFGSQCIYGLAFQYPQYDFFQLNKRSGNYAG